MVEVSTDDGRSWRAAQLVENRERYEWTVWKFRFAPREPGIYHLRVRATAGDGKRQPPRDPQNGSGMSGQPRLDLEIAPA
jgi:hypothetical protein